MTVRELIAELSKYPPDAELRLETQEGSTSVEKVDCYAGRVVKLFGNGWDDLPEDDDEEEYGDEAYDYFDDEDEEDDGE